MAIGIDSVLLVAGAALALALAGVVVLVSPKRRANRLLALLFVLSGISTLLWGDWGSLSRHPIVVLVNGVGSAFIGLTYVYFLAETLETPFVAPFRRRPARVAVAALSALSTVPFLAAFATEVGAGRALDPEALFEAIAPSFLLNLLILVYGLAASLSAWRRAARGSLVRARAGHFALAFGVRDALVFVAIATIVVPQTADLAWPGLLFPIALIASVPLLAYGILKTQLFDIDLRLKEGVRRGTVVAAFLVAFGLVAVAVERATTATLGLAAGGVGVLLLLFALVPLHRFAGRVADRAFPDVRDDDAYLARRKLEVYRVALEDALARDADGGAERDPVLADLRRALRVTLDQHAALVVALRPRAAAALPAHFEVERELGRGSFGRALLARDRLLDRRVVLKQPLALGAATAEGRALVLREARIAAQIHHPNVVAVYQVLADLDPPVIVLEHVDGESLAERLAREGPLAPAEAARIALDALAGLERIHGAGIVHRDLKPANVLITRDGTAKITDFGVAHAPATGDAARAFASTGHHPGSPAYMSPEQARGDRLDARSDLYSLGVILHEAVTGSLPPPPAGATVAALRAPALPARAEVPSALAPVLARALETAPAARFADAAQMAAALRLAQPVRA